MRAVVAGQAGFTLIEMMLAIVLTTVGLLAVAGVFPHGLALALYGKDQTKAAGLAQREIEDLKNQPTSALDNDKGDYGTTVSEYFDQNGNTASASTAYFTVDLQVQYWTWNAASGQFTESGTPYTKPASGAYLYRVSTAAHWPVRGQTAFVSGSGSPPVTGCVAGGAAAATGIGCVQVSTFITP